jgi:hypothetical protein
VTPRRQPVIRLARNTAINLSSVSRLPVLRMRDMTSEQDDLVGVCLTPDLSLLAGLLDTHQRGL